MSLSLLPLSALELISDYLPIEVDVEDSPALCALGRWAFSIRLWRFLARVKQIFEDLWERREELQFEEWAWTAGNTPISPHWGEDGYWTDGDLEPINVEYLA